MKPRWLMIVVLAGLLPFASCARAAEPFLEFVNELRNHDYHDFAILYLEKLDQRTDVPAEIIGMRPYEKGITLVEAARRETSPEGQTRQLDLASMHLDEFLK